MTIFDLLKGKTIMVNTDMKVKLTIQEVSEKSHSVDLEPSTRENDWWPQTKDWTTYIVKFTNGSTKEYSNISDIKIEE